MSLKARIERIERRQPPQGDLKALSDLELAAVLWLLSKMRLDYFDSSGEARASSLSKMIEIEARHPQAELEQASQRVQPFVLKRLAEQT